MRYSFALVALAALVAADSSSAPSYTNPNTSFLTETNSLGVVTGQPAVNTDVNTDVVTSQPSVVTSQPAVATSPAGTPTNLPTAVVSSKVVGGTAPLATGTAGSAKNGTVSTGSLKATASSSKGSSGASSTNSNVGGSGGTPSSTASSSSSSSTAKNAAGVLEPVVGLGLAGAAFALFL